MVLELLKNIPIILGSQSPRRQELLASMGVDFEVIVRSVDEQISEEVEPFLFAEKIALKKLTAFTEQSFDNYLIITADTVVVDPEGNILGKPENYVEAKAVLQGLSNRSHVVYTGVALRYHEKIMSFTSATKVYFDALSDAEIDYYLETYKPYDKAGSYGIQEWIGRIGVNRIEGSFENVMGLPTNKLYAVLKDII